MIFSHAAVDNTQHSFVSAMLQSSICAKNVVITHHLPSRFLVAMRHWPARGPGDGINGAFVGACDDIMKSDFAPNLWIHGHTHDTIDAIVHNTRIVCNPSGYKSEWGSRYNIFYDNKLRPIPKFVEI